ncbi:MAG: SCP2 sterol-binding domain-containing protein [Trueperaceae bacterium]|nr:SCP2 sterol-binding domain-containing protein [Trueperaceae bacterium]
MTARQLLERLAGAIDADQAGDLRAVVQYDLSEPAHQVIEAGVVRTVEGPAEAPDVTLTLVDDDLIALFEGRLAPSVAFLSGRLRIAGDVVLAQRLVDLLDIERLAQEAGSPPVGASADASADG